MKDLSEIPWKMVSTRPIYQNRWLSLREDLVELPNGRTTIYGGGDRKPRPERASRSEIITVARTARGICGGLLAERRPFQQGVECWTERLAPRGQRVFDLGRHLMVDDPPHHPVVLHLAKLLDQHLL